MGRKVNLFYFKTTPPFVKGGVVFILLIVNCFLLAVYSNISKFGFKIIIIPSTVKSTPPMRCEYLLKS
ncbi:hypothetical protein A3H55_00045 [Candidatus Kuenenbacteria bacterium RIFCSPLOWO2_02_FULL_42_16]|uniref:Uncharacterized protein n=1 Tax=Candidatus Kuenenbacteria bacterium RIFCSPLOWO2_02_FULL_42_16 TaxID=1798564 RepID=A0A1F6FY38_9BACT|nr:MAG: hypothetical protein A3H55_00045 [Candidatus Kuenenbacteria bacterium RIFCSPLOWO2_02_FULL_42_16]